MIVAAAAREALGHGTQYGAGHEAEVIWGEAVLRMVPVAEDMLHQLRSRTAAVGTLLIFDEVISGFRCSPGGAQQAFGINPDLTTPAKIVAGGLPGGAVAGRGDILDQLDFAAMEAAKRTKILHPGTFDAGERH